MFTSIQRESKLLEQAAQEAIKINFLQNHASLSMYSKGLDNNKIIALEQVLVGIFVYSGAYAMSLLVNECLQKYSHTPSNYLEPDGQPFIDGLSIKRDDEPNLYLEKMQPEITRNFHPLEKLVVDGIFRCSFTTR